MIWEELSIFIENKRGSLAEVTAILSSCDLSIYALQLADYSDFGTLRLIADDNNLALDALEKQGFLVEKRQVIAVEVVPSPKGLHRILDVLSSAEINLEYIYPLSAPHEKAIFVLGVSEAENVLDVLQSQSISVVSFQHFVR